MKRSWRLLFTLVAMCLVGAVTYFGLIRVLLLVSGKISANVGAAIVAGLVTALVALYNQKTAKLREIAESHRPQKIALYEVYMEIIDHFTDASVRGELTQITTNALPSKLEKLMKDFRTGLLIWGSPEVILSWHRMRRPRNGNEVLREADGVFRAIRKDLGNSNSGLGEGDLIKLFLKDPDDYGRFVCEGGGSLPSAAADIPPLGPTAQ